MTGFIGEKLQQILDEGGAGGGGGGLPLYRHTIEVYENNADTFDIFIQLISTSSEVADTEDKVKALLGTGENPCICTGCMNSGEIVSNAGLIRVRNGVYEIYDDVQINGSSIDLFSDEYDLIITDTVTAIDNASAAVTTLYRHDVLLYESGGDNFEVALSILSADETSYDTLDKVKNAVGIDKPMMVSGSVMRNGNATPACYVSFGTSAMNFWFDIDVEREHSYTDIVVNVTDTVRPLASITVNGSGGGVVTDLGQQDGHLSAQNTIIELLKPDSVPQGSYIYSYWTDCAGNSALAIAYKCNSHIRCSQISSNGEIRKFTYEFSPENVIEQCFRPMGVEILPNTGESTTAVMSQKAVTDALASAGGGSGNVQQIYQVIDTTGTFEIPIGSKHFEITVQTVGDSLEQPSITWTFGDTVISHHNTESDLTKFIGNNDGTSWKIFRLLMSRNNNDSISLSPKLVIMRNENNNNWVSFSSINGIDANYYDEEISEDLLIDLISNSYRDCQGVYNNKQVCGIGYRGTNSCTLFFIDGTATVVLFSEFTTKRIFGKQSGYYTTPFGLIHSTRAVDTNYWEDIDADKLTITTASYSGLTMTIAGYYLL